MINLLSSKKKRIRGVLVLSLFSVLFFSTFVFAIDDLITLQGNVLSGATNLDSGNLTVYIYDAIAAGNIVWNSTLDSSGQYNNSISSGKYDVLLGNSSDNELSLAYGNFYYIEMYVNTEKFSFNGSDRQIFQSSVGQINGSFINPGQINVTHLDGNLTLQYITGGENIVFSNDSVTFDAGYNVSTGVGGWFKGLFNWVINSSSAYLSFNGTSLSFDEAKLNATISDLTAESVTSTIGNDTYYPIGQNMFDQQLNTTNKVFFEELNVSQLFANGVNVSPWLYNQTAAANTYADSQTFVTSQIGNDTYLIGNPFDQQLNTTGDVVLNSLNVTNQLRVGSTLLQADADTTLNITGTTNFNNGWQSGGVTIAGGDVFVQTLYAVNITSLGISDLAINGSILPHEDFNNTFDLGNLSLQWRDAYFGREVYVGGVAASPWLFNQSAIEFNFNQSAIEFNFNQSAIEFNFNQSNIAFNYNQTAPANTYTDNQGFISGNIFNQVLNTTNNVTFNVINSSRLIVGRGSTSDPTYGFAGLILESPGTGATSQATFYIQSGANTYSNIYFGDYSDLTDGRIRYNNSGSEMEFYTNSLERMVIDGDGKVGIRTASPKRALDVNGSIIMKNGELLRFRNSTGDEGGDDGVGIYRAGGNALRVQYALNSMVFDALDNKSIQFRNSEDITTHQFALNGGGYTYFNNPNGRVGIGTATPAALLDVEGAGFPEIRITSTSGSVGDGSNLSLLTYTNDKTYAQIQGLWSASGDADIVFKTTTDGAVTLPERMRITDDGLVGIGTESPAALLDIVGAGSGDGILLNISGGNIGYLATIENIQSSTYASGLLINVHGSASATNSAGLLNVQESGTSRFLVDADGNVGIGTGNPTRTLDVRGDANFSSTIYINNGTDLSTIGPAGSSRDNALFIYDAGGAFDIATSYLNLTFDTVVRSDSAYTYGTDDPAVVINNNGWYDITFECAADNTHASARYHTDFRILLNGATINGGEGFGYNRVVNDGKNTVSINAVASLSSGDELNFQALTDDTGSDVTTVANACRVKIAIMDNNGGINGTYWNQTGTDLWYTTGNVGIGTKSPTYNLEVNGSVLLQGLGNATAEGSSIEIQNASSDFKIGGNLLLKAGNAAAGLTLGGTVNITGGDGGVTGGPVQIKAGNSLLGGNLILDSGTGSITPGYVLLNPNQGKDGTARYVGIGTAAPTALLHVVLNDSTSDSDVMRFEQVAQNGGAGLSFFKNYNNTPGGNIGHVHFRTLDSASNEDIFATMRARSYDITSGAEEGGLVFEIMAAGTSGVDAFFVNSSTFQFGTTTYGGVYEFEDGSVCIGSSGCVAPTTSGRLLVEGAITAGHTSTFAFNSFGNGANSDDANIGASNDVYIEDSLEVDGTFYLTGGSAVIVNSDIAEVLLTKKGRDNVLCEGDSSCVVEDGSKDELDYGDLVCIDPSDRGIIMKCNEANSRLAVGFVSNTSRMNMGNNLKYGYPIAVAGLVWSKVTNENGNIFPGDLIVSSSKPGFAMKNNDPKIGTVVGKAYDFCSKDECDMLVFVALS